MNIKLASILALSLALAACSTERPNPNNSTGAETAMAEASYSVSRSLVNLSEVAQASRPLPDLEPPASPATYGMGGLTSVDWSGPVEPLAKQLANASGYRLRVLGTPPGLPVLVTIYAKNTMMADIVRDLGYQCGRRADIIIFPESRIIELRYAKN